MKQQIVRTSYIINNNVIMVYGREHTHFHKHNFLIIF